MLKKIIMIIIVFAMFCTTQIYAITGEGVLESEQATELVDMK